MRQTTLVATVSSPPSREGGELTALPAGVGILEVRADLVGDLDADWLRDRFPGQLIYTLRSRAEGGRFEGGRQSRAARLAAAAGKFDFIDLEATRDLGRDLLRQITPETRLLSWHGASLSLTGLRTRFDQMAATPARFYKLIPRAVHMVDSLTPLILLHSLKRHDVVAFAAGEIGSWTRLLAPRLGSPLVYGSLGDVPAAAGQLPVARLCHDYALPLLPEAHQLFGIVGRPVLHSLSPRLHNGAYRALGVEGLYVPFHAESFGDFWLDVVEAPALGVLGLPLQGLSVTSPYKEVALAVSGASSPRAQHIVAANTLTLNEGVWEAETTDPEGVVELLFRHGVEMHQRRAAVVGCGGAGKASAYGLQLAGADVTLINRGEERGRKAAHEMHLPFVKLADFDPAIYDVIVHATALGHSPDDDLPFAVDAVGDGATVVDLVYDRRPTPLVEALRARGRRVFEGRQVLLEQALKQFRLMTGKELVEPLARELLGLEALADQEDVE